MSKITNDGLTQSVIELYSYGNSGRQRVQAEKPSSGQGKVVWGLKPPIPKGIWHHNFFTWKKNKLPDYLWG